MKDSGQWWECGSPTLPPLALLSSLPQSSSTEGSMSSSPLLTSASLYLRQSLSPGMARVTRARR